MGLKITLSGQTIVKPTALGPVANTDTKLLIYGAISKGPSFGTGRGVDEAGGKKPHGETNGLIASIVAEVTDGCGKMTG